MTYATGAAECVRKGLHKWVRLSATVEWCDCCGASRTRLFTDDDVDRFEAADANRAAHEACGNPSDNEADAHRGNPE